MGTQLRTRESPVGAKNPSTEDDFDNPVGFFAVRLL